MQKTVTFSTDIIKRMGITGFILVDGERLSEKYGLQLLETRSPTYEETTHTFLILNEKLFTFVRLKYGV